MLERVGTYLFVIFCFWLVFRFVGWWVSWIPDKLPTSILIIPHNLSRYLTFPTDPKNHIPYNSPACL